MEIIQNDSLREVMKSHYKASRKSAKSRENDVGFKMLQEVIYPKFFKAWSYHGDAVPLDFESLKQESEFLIALDYLANSGRFFRERTNNRIESANLLLELIRQELCDD
jgi:hypothetical protein